MSTEPKKFAQEPAEGDRDVIDHELERQQNQQASREPPRPDPAKDNSNWRP